MQKFRFEGLTLTVASIDRAVDFYGGKLGLKVAHNASPHFAMIRTEGGGTIGLLSFEEAEKDGALAATPEQRRGVHVEFSTGDLDSLYAELTAAGVHVDVPPHDEPWERSMTVFDPDGHSVEFAQGRRGSNAVPGTPAEGQEP